MANSLKVAFAVVLYFQTVYTFDYGIIYVEKADDPSIHKSFCMAYNPKFKELAPSLDTAIKRPLADLYLMKLCDDEEPPTKPSVAGAIAMVARGNCSFSEKAFKIQAHKGEGILIVSNESLSVPVGSNQTDYDEINISVALMEESDYHEIKNISNNLNVKLFSPPRQIDLNLVLIWTMAVTTVAVGSYWSGTVKHRQFTRHRRRPSSGSHRSDDQKDDVDDDDDDDEQETFDVSPKVVIIFVIMMCTMLVSLYFLYDYLVYLIIALFCCASVGALYACLKPIISRIPCIPRARLPPNRIPLFSTQPEVWKIFLILFCMGMAIWWGIERNKSYAWILQNTLGIAFCLNMMKVVRLPSLKACTILLVLLFFYDIFFVFITPLITKSGESIMVQVATGGNSSSGEQVPMVLKVPPFLHTALSICQVRYSLLGFGDILVPGLLVSYCYGFDLKVQSGKIYFFATTIAYSCGLLITFAALAVMEQGQPALLYLVPCTLLTTVIIGAKRGELKHLWRGELGKMDNVSNNNGEHHVTPPSATDQPIPAAMDPNSINAEISSSASDRSDNEQQQLLINR